MIKGNGKIHEILHDMNHIIENGNQKEFIEWAKNYNIFQKSNNKFYNDTCKKIRERLAIENLSEDILRQEDKT